MKVLVTGAAGFIGSRLMHALLDGGAEVVGIDSLNDYYDVRLKYARLAALGVAADEFVYGEELRSAKYPSLRFRTLRIEDRDGMERLFAEGGFDIVVNLAAQAGVRYSLENPYAYIESNIAGFVTLLECCRHYPVRHLVYASSSSVYGGNEKVPFSEEDDVNMPVSLYAATKRSDELIARTYARLYKIPSTGLRFFTVYGEWGRPDMAPMLFTRAILDGRPLKVFNYGDMARDFTYVGDIVEGVVRLLDKAPDGDIPTDIFNIGCGHPVQLLDFIRTLESALGHKAVLDMQPMQAGDVPRTYADTSKLARKTGYCPQTDLRAGIGRFVEWYMSDENPLRD